MTVRWYCPGCHWTTDQPDCVVSIGHRCNPNVPRTWRNLRRQEPPSTGGDNQTTNTGE